MSTDFTSYQSVFAWRYGSPPMRGIWSETHKRRLWRRIWVAMAETQAQHGIVTREQAADLRAHMEQVDMQRALAIESEIHHDLMAEVRAFAEQCPVGGGIIHLGATSMDVEDNADVLRVRDALDLIVDGTRRLLEAFVAQCERYADLPAMAFTHIQPAEPTTVGYRLAQHAQDAWTDYGELTRTRANLKGKGFRGAVGTSASYAELLGAGLAEFEPALMAQLGLEAFPVATQVYARKQDWLVLNALAGLGQTLYKFAFDLRLLQTPPIGEWSEPFRARQVGSSAMPFKRNPINAEKINSLARYLAALPRVAWDDAAHTLLERTLDDSANRRLILPDAFLAADELLITATRIVKDLRVNEPAIARNFAAYGVFAATERLLMALVKRGADRQEMHEVIRERAMAAWAEVAQGRANPLADLLCADARVLAHLDADEARALLDAGDYTGDAPQRTRALVRMIREETLHD